MIYRRSNAPDHLVIPDTQIKPGVPLAHLEACGNYIVAKQPKVIIHLGDHWDMPSLSKYDVGTIKIEGARYVDDVAAGYIGMDMLLNPLWEYNHKRARQKMKQYKPRMIFLVGNHEHRITRAANENPKFEDKISLKDLEIDKFGWEVSDFLVPTLVDGVAYSHYFYNPMSGHPWGGKTNTKLNNIGFSFTQGHQQGKDSFEKSLANGKVLRGLVVGSFYQHEEEYKGPQANNHWRGIIHKHEVKDGNYCLTELSLEYLLRRWL